MSSKPKCSQDVFTCLTDTDLPPGAGAIYAKNTKPLYHSATKSAIRYSGISYCKEYLLKIFPEFQKSRPRQSVFDGVDFLCMEHIFDVP